MARPRGRDAARPRTPAVAERVQSIFAASTSATPVPRWKTALVIALAIYPASLIVNVVLVPCSPAGCCRCGCSPTAVPRSMVWLAVPWISARLDGWLHAAPEAEPARA